MSEEIEISYDPDWLTVQVIFLVALSTAIGHGLGSNFSDWIISLIISSILVSLILIGWEWFSVRPRVNEVEL